MAKPFYVAIPVTRSFCKVKREARPASGRDGPPTEDMYCIYVLQSLKDKRTYVGFTDDVERRLEEHNTGRSRATKH